MLSFKLGMLLSFYMYSIYMGHLEFISVQFETMKVHVTYRCFIVT